MGQREVTGGDVARAEAGLAGVVPEVRLRGVAAIYCQGTPSPGGAAESL